MKNLIQTPSDVNKIEYWMATTVFVFAVFFLVTSSVSNRWTVNQIQFQNLNQEFNYFANFFMPNLIRYSAFYGLYCLLTFVIVPPLIRKENMLLNGIMGLVSFGLLSLVLGASDTWLKGYLFSQESLHIVNSNLFQDSAIYSLWLLLMFSLYSSIKALAIYLLENTDLIQSKYRIVTRDGIYAFILWMIAVFILIISEMDQEGVIMLGTCSLFAIVLYCYSLYSLLPEIFRRPKAFKKFFWKVSGIVLIVSIPLSLFLILILPNHKNEFVIITLMLNLCLQLVLTVPVSWYVFKYRMTVDYEIKGLQTALGRSTADLNFLRSQINPHFLFNVLNTLYGTALQENADRSAEGIQKLGDMMRFMLHENMQDKISVTREIEYLSNYIDLQKLRTQSSSAITINSSISDYTGCLQIAPMLLIPFIENAFKHGISLKEESFIRISLNIQNDTLFFDITNSMHDKVSNDPERDNNGIGLQNVKQRLKLLYSHAHELAIRENGKEFFVHLTIKLGS